MAAQKSIHENWLGFYPEATVETHMDLLGRWLRRHGRPGALYTDRHSIFEPQVVAIPLVQKMSLWATGIPSSGPVSPAAPICA